MEHYISGLHGPIYMYSQSYYQYIETPAEKINFSMFTIVNS